MKQFLLIVIIFLIPGSLMASVSEKRVALIIGNAAYKSMPLQNTLNDARAMENALRKCDFQIISELDANMLSMIQAIQKFGDEIKHGGVGLFYYAGHGVQVKGENYLVPIGVKVFSEAEVLALCLKASYVLEIMEIAGNRLNIVILDACRNNPFSGFRSAAQGLARMEAPAGTIIQYATGKGDVTRDEDKQNTNNGLYTSKLLEHILTPGLEIRFMFSRVREDVYEASGKKQTPWEDSSMMGGYFYFKPMYADGSTTIIKPQPQLNLQTGALRIKTNPTSAEVYVNNAYKGESPQDISGLNPGEIRIRVQKEGYKTVYQNTRITSGEINILSIILDPEITTGSLRVQPEDARIRIMNIREPFYQGIDLAPGKYHLEISKNGYETHSEWVQIIAGITNKFKIDLKKKSQLTGTFTNRLGMTFVLIKAGRFMMGSPSNEPKRESDEKQHTVVLTKDFYIQTTEVTQGQWKAVMGNNPSFFKACGVNCPVERVSWDDSQEFIKKLNQMGDGYYRLPTEAEWEYAARAGTTTPFAFGNCLNTDKANYDGNYPLTGCSKGKYRKKTISVASLGKNVWGLYDMHGNVEEWCSDRYGDYPDISVTDPGPSSGSSRVFRGGSWSNYGQYCRSARRDGNSPGYRDGHIGLRLKRTLNP
jgi:formylglycine-generating enzyme required for sulfatase activity